MNFIIEFYLKQVVTDPFESSELEAWWFYPGHRREACWMVKIISRRHWTITSAKNHCPVAFIEFIWGQLAIWYNCHVHPAHNVFGWIHKGPIIDQATRVITGRFWVNKQDLADTLMKYLLSYLFISLNEKTKVTFSL